MNLTKLFKFITIAFSKILRVCIKAFAILERLRGALKINDLGISESMISRKLILKI